MPSIFGLVRFSYLTRKNAGFRQGKGLPLERRAELLFAPKRMERRFRLFTTFCLPSLVAQPKELFCGVLLGSDLMPEHHKARLRECVSRHENLVVAFEPPGAMGAAFQPVLSRLAVDGPAKATFRLDDDDAVSTDFSEQLERYLALSFSGQMVSLSRGFEASRLFGRPRLWRKQWVFGSAGLALVSRANSTETVYSCGDHLRVSRERPVIVDGRRESWLMTSHGGNNSRRQIPLRKRYSWAASLDVSRAAAELEATFRFLAAVDWAAL